MPLSSYPRVKPALAAAIVVLILSSAATTVRRPITFVIEANAASFQIFADKMALMRRDVVRRVVAVMLLLRNVVEEGVLDIRRSARTWPSPFLLRIERSFDRNSSQRIKT